MKGAGIILVLGLMCGCTAAEGLSASARKWTHGMGGVVEHPAHPVLQEATDSLARSAGLSPITVHILGDSEPAAYAWPSNDVFLTAALIRELEFGEIEAVIAHELAHLAKHHGRPVSLALGGRGELDIDQELEADLIGMRNLIDSGRDPAVMLDMLRAVRDMCRPDGNARRGLSRRVDRVGYVLNAHRSTQTGGPASP